MLIPTMPRGIYKRTKAMREAIRQSRLGTKATPEARAKMKQKAIQRACRPEWREKVSRGTRKAMRKRSVRAKHLAALIEARKKHGVNFKTFGRELVKFEIEMSKILCPLGYVQQYSVRTTEKTFFLDFALVKEKIAIECDGPKYRSFDQQKYDKWRDSLLHKLGWKVIRVPHV